MASQDNYLKALKLARDCLYALNSSGTRSEIVQTQSFRGVSLLRIARTLNGFSDAYRGDYYKSANLIDFFDKCYVRNTEFTRLRRTVETKYIPRQETQRPERKEKELDFIDAALARGKGEIIKEGDKRVAEDDQSQERDEVVDEIAELLGLEEKVSAMEPSAEKDQKQADIDKKRASLKDRVPETELKGLEERIKKRFEAKRKLNEAEQEGNPEAIDGAQKTFNQAENDLINPYRKLNPYAKYGLETYQKYRKLEHEVNTYTNQPGKNMSDYIIDIAHKKARKQLDRKVGQAWQQYGKPYIQNRVSSVLTPTRATVRPNIGNPLSPISQVSPSAASNFLRGAASKTAAALAQRAALAVAVPYSGTILLIAALLLAGAFVYFWYYQYNQNSLDLYFQGPVPTDVSVGPPGSHEGGGNPNPVIATVYYCQANNSWINTCSLGVAGCGPTSMAIISSSFGLTYTPPQMDSVFQQSGARSCSDAGSSIPTFINSGWLQSNGFTSLYINNGGYLDLQTAQQYINNKYLILASSGVFPCPHPGWCGEGTVDHIFVIDGIDVANNSFHVEDPANCRPEHPDQYPTNQVLSNSFPLLYAIAIKKTN